MLVKGSRKAVKGQWFKVYDDVSKESFAVFNDNKVKALQGLTYSAIACSLAKKGYLDTNNIDARYTRIDDKELTQKELEKVLKGLKKYLGYDKKIVQAVAKNIYC